jgi:hypothetical protein
MTESDDPPFLPNASLIPVPQPDEMLQAAANWLDTANLTPEDREIVTSQTVDMAAKLSVFCNALASSRASAATRSHVFLEHVKDLLVSPSNMAMMANNPHALMELMKVLQKSLDSETKYLADMTSPDRMQGLQDARLKASKTKKKSDNSEDSDIKDRIAKLPSHKREKVRSLLDSILGVDKIDED